MANYTTLTLCLLIGPVLGLLQAWPYLYDYLGSYLHYSDENITIDDVRLTMNAFGQGEAIGGLFFATHVALFGYKRFQIFMILINSVCFLFMSNNTNIETLYLINFMLGYTLASGITCVSFQCMTTYPDMGAVASGIGMSGFSVSASVWAIVASIVINPEAIDPVNKFYPLEVAKRTTYLFRLAFFFSLTMAGLCSIFLKDPERLKKLSLSIMMSFDTEQISKISQDNKKIIEDSQGEYYESFMSSINITNFLQGGQDKLREKKIFNLLEKSNDSLLDELVPRSGTHAVELKTMGFDKIQPYLNENPSTHEIQAFAKNEVEQEKNIKRKLSCVDHTLETKLENRQVSLSQREIKTDQLKKDVDLDSIGSNRELTPQNNQPLLQKQLEGIEEVLDFKQEETKEINQKDSIDEDVRRIRGTIRFWYYILFITLQYAAPYWHMMNMKSEGLKYHSEKYIVNSLIYAPLFSAFGRVMGGVLINKLGLKKTYLFQVALNIITSINFACFYNYKIIYTICCYFFGFNMGVGSVCFFTTTIYIYGIDLSVRLSTWVSLAAPLSLVICSLTQKFIYPNFGLSFTEAEFGHLFLTMMVRINWLDP